MLLDWILLTNSASTLIMITHAPNKHYYPIMKKLSETLMCTHTIIWNVVLFVSRPTNQRPKTASNKHKQYMTECDHLGFVATYYLKHACWRQIMLTICFTWLLLPRDQSIDSGRRFSAHTWKCIQREHNKHKVSVAMTVEYHLLLETSFSKSFCR